WIINLTPTRIALIVSGCGRRAFPNDDELAVELLRDLTNFGFVTDERSVWLGAARHVERLARRVVGGVDPDVATLAEAASGDGTRFGGVFVFLFDRVVVFRCFVARLDTGSFGCRA